MGGGGGGARKALPLFLINIHTVLLFHQGGMFINDIKIYHLDLLRVRILHSS
jgi:hypothetical protein